MKKAERRQALRLTLLVTGLVLCVVLATVLVSGALVYLLVHLGVLKDPDGTAYGTGQLLLVFAAACFVVSAVITFFASRIPLRPVQRIISRLNAMAKGDFHSRIRIGQPWEKNPSVAALQDSINRLSEELERTEMLRSDFINNFSHEFKTPIVSIAGFAKLLRRAQLDEEKQREYIAIIEEESMRLSRMATNVLALTKVENQTILTEVTAYNLSEQLRSCVLLLAEKWEQKKLDFAADFGEYTIEANEALLKQVWINLVDNAVKFSPHNSVVEITITEQEETLAVAIRNCGEEIAPEQYRRIFNKFYQADESHAAEGSGIGLAIVHRAVALHGGEVTVDSREGFNTFTVTLPKKRR